MKPLTRLLVTVLSVSAFLLFASVAVSFAGAAQWGGVNVHPLWDSESDAQMTDELNLAASAHVTVLRIDVGWSSYEFDGPGQYPAPRVAKLDRFMQGAASRGIKVLPVVFSTPCWASSAPESLRQGCTGDWWNRGVTAYPPKDPQTYGNFVKWLTNRYSAYMAGVEVWNEPNETAFLNAPDQASAYAQLLKAGYAGAKAGNLDVPVIAGAIAGADVGFLNQLYAAGIKGYYDGLSIHTYSGSQSPMFDPGAVGRQATVLPGIKAVHAAQLAAGDTTALWLTEFGWVTQAGLYSAVTEQQQAAFISSAFTSIEQLPYVRAAVVYDLRDGPDPSSYIDHYGLVTENFTPKPAFAALQTVLSHSATVASTTSSRSTVRRKRAPIRGGKRARAKATADSPSGSSSVLHLGSRLGKLRAGNVYDRTLHGYRLGVWLVGGRVHVLSVRAQARPFNMVLTMVSRGSAALVFARCGAASSACRLFDARLTAAGEAKHAVRISAGSRIFAAPAGRRFLARLRIAA